MAIEPTLVYEAVIEYTGYGSAPYPTRDVDRVVARFGGELAAELIPAVTALEDDFYRSPARHTSADLVAMGDRAIADFRELRPEVPTEIVDALAWCYTFDYK